MSPANPCGLSPGCGRCHRPPACSTTCWPAFLSAGLVDELIAYVAPTLLGAGAGLVGPLGVDTITDAIRLQTLDVTVLGDDVRLTARPTGRNT